MQIKKYGVNITGAAIPQEEAFITAKSTSDKNEESWVIFLSTNSRISGQYDTDPSNPFSRTA